MQKLLNLSYWFDPLPGEPDLGIWKILFAISIATVLVAVICIFVYRKKKSNALHRKLYGRLMAWGFTIGPVLALLGFFRFQNAYLLGMRLWYGLWLLWAVLWLLWIIKYAVRDMPRRSKVLAERAAFEQYLPRKK